MNDSIGRFDDRKPGVRELHLLRLQACPLVSEEKRSIDHVRLERARLHDNSDREAFMVDFQQLVQQAVELEPNTPSETILALKEQLDQAYQRACALPGDQEEIKGAIRKLVAVIMQSIRNGIGNDNYARRQLDDEDLAREEHFALQEIPLVSALTHADSPVAEDELVPCLLCEEPDTLARILHLFDDRQTGVILNDATRLLTEQDPDRAQVNAWQNLAAIQSYFASFPPPDQKTENG